MFKVIRLAVVCPSCGSPPRLRTFPTSADLLQDADPEEEVLTYRCHIRRCQEVYPIRVRDFRMAC